LILHTPPKSLLHPIFEPVGAVIVGGRKVIVFLSDPLLQNDPSRPPFFKDNALSDPEILLLCVNA
jgi:hypothetical protein